MSSGSSSDPTLTIENLKRRIAQLEAEVEASREHEALINAVLDHGPDFITRVAPDGTYLFVNRLVEGSRYSDVVGRSAFDFVAPEMRQPLRETFDRVIRTRQPDRIECTATAGPERMARYFVRVAPVIEDERVVALTLISTDVTRLKEAERALRDSEQKLRIALAASGMGLWSWDQSKDEVEWDETMCRIFGVDAYAAPKTYEEFLALLPEDERARVTTTVAKSFETGAYGEHEYRVVLRDGSTRWVLSKATVLKDDAGRPNRLIGGMLDVTERKRLEEHVRQAQKMDAIGALTAGIAHNFNNMLAGILPNIEIAESMGPPKAAAMLATAREAAMRAAKLIRELLGFSGRRDDQTRERQLEDAGALVRRTLDICRTTFDRAIGIDLDASAQPLFAEVDAVQIEQALLNVLINARDALEGIDGRPLAIRVTVDRVAAGADELRNAGAGSDTPHVRIRISDNGCGMDETARRRIYEPFFTTKDVGRGTGLGLTTTYAIVTEHGGLVTCDSTRGIGTSFTIYLPAAPCPSACAAKAQCASRTAGGHERILVVDDEPLVRTSVARLLATEGYEVLQAEDGAVALEILRGRHAEIDLVILDHSMPKISGRQLLEALRSFSPEKKVISFSGGMAGPVEGARAVLEKPTGAEVLLRTVRHVLDAP